MSQFQKAVDKLIEKELKIIKEKRAMDEIVKSTIVQTHIDSLIDRTKNGKD